MLRGEELKADNHWTKVLANDYCEPRHHIQPGSRHQAKAAPQLHLNSWHSDRCLLPGKIVIHPVSIKPFGVGPACQSRPNPRAELMLLAGILFTGGWISTMITLFLIARNTDQARVTMG